ncbi:MAG: TVP38/TMEM64 family protein, partial [Candidatus Binatia bacterium]
MALALVVTAAALASGVDLRREWVEALRWVRGLGPRAEAGFLAIYVPAALLLLPSTFLDLGAGTLFGVVRGSFLVSAGSLVAATASFLLARHL